MNRILMLLGHPALRRSTINAALLRAVAGLDRVGIHDLYARYPDSPIDVPYEQALCKTHDVIVFQHPFYWYSTPAIIKERKNGDAYPASTGQPVLPRVNEMHLGTMKIPALRHAAMKRARTVRKGTPWKHSHVR